MTTLQQALHIFRKDARAFRLEIAGILFLNLFLVLACTQTWEALQEHGPRARDNFAEQALLPIAWILLIARAIHTEALPGDRHFWLTRPYNRGGLLLAKMLLIVTFINLPYLLAQAAILTFSGHPLAGNIGGLILDQLVYTGLILIPAAAIAALTRNLAQFLPAAVLIVAVLVLMVGEGRVIDRPPDWVRVGFGILLAATAGGVILVMQYWTRRTARHAIFVGISYILGIILVASFPDSAAYAVQSAVVGSGQNQQVTIGAPKKRPPSAVTPHRYRQLVEFPITLTGADAQDIVLNAPRSVTFRTLAGVSRKFWAEGRDFNAIRVAIDRDFYEAAKNSPVRVQVQFTLTQYGLKTTVAVPRDGTPVTIAGVGECGTFANYFDRSFLCRVPFAPPMRSTVIGAGSVQLTKGLFPFRMELNPLRRYSFEFPPGEGGQVAPLEPEAPLQVRVREPVAFLHDQLDVPNIKLADYAIPEPAGEGQE